MRSSRLVSDRALACLLAPLALGCGELIGAGEYATDDVSNPCGPLEVLAEGACVKVGVQRCADGFLDDRRGGCTAVMPEAPCPPESGFLARPGVPICSPLSPLVCTSLTFWPDVVPLEATAHVLAGARAGGDGSKELPFGSIEQALASTAQDLSLVIGPGDYTTPIVIEGRRVDVYGLCPTWTRLRSTNAGPAIRVAGPAASGSRIQTLSVTGAGPGIEVTGARDVVLSAVWAHDLDGPGISIFDGDPSSGGETSVRAETCVIDRAAGAGIAVHGASFELVRSAVWRTGTLAARGGQRGLGIWASPEPLFEGNDPSVRRPAEVELVESAVVDSIGAGVFAEGARVSVRGSVIRGVAPDALGRGRGIEIRATSPGRVDTRLDVSGSLIEGAHDVGISSWNADLSLQGSVVRDVGAATGERCLGNGLRARYDLLRDADGSGPRLTVENSLIERTREAGIHVEGGSARVESSIVRETSSPACRTGLGDGVAAYASPAGPARIEIDKVRIEHSTRAGVAVFSTAGEPPSRARIESSVIECSGPAIGGQSAAAEIRNSLCRCNGSWSRCDEGVAGLERALLGRSGCDAADATACFRGCVGSIEGQAIVPNTTIWPFGRDEIASVASGEDGCFEIEGLPRDTPLVMALAHAEYMNGFGMVSPLAADSPARFRAELVPSALLSITRELTRAAGDGRRGLLLLVRVCRVPRRLAPPSETICAGLPGLTVSLEPGTASARHYFRAYNLPDPENPLSETEGADTVFVEVEPGEQFVTIEPPAGRLLHCELEAGGLGWPTETPNRFRVFVEAGWTVFGMTVNCTLSP